MATERGRVEVEARLRNARRFQADAYASAHAVDEIGDAANRADAKIIGLNARVTLFRNALGLVKPAALVTGIGLAAQGIDALGAGAVALSGALGPLSGLMVAYPGLGLAAAQGFGAWKFAMSGVTDAVGGLNAEMNPKKLALLSSEGQSLAFALDGVKAPIRDLQKATQHGLFPGLTASMRIVRPMLGDFRDEMQATGVALGGVVKRFALFARQAGPDFQTLMGRNAVYIGRMGDVAVHLASALRHVLIAAGPLLDWLTKGAVKWARWIDFQARAGRESGRLAGFFGRTRVVAASLWHTLRDVGMALFNIAKGGQGLGGDMLDSLERGAAAFRAWTESARGTRRIAGYFNTMRPAVFELGRLARDLVKSFVALGEDTHLAPLIAKLRTGLLPAVQSIIGSTTSSFGPVLIDGLVRVGDLLTAMSGTTGPLTILIAALGQLASALAWVMRNVPGAKELGTALIIIAGASRLFKLGAMVTGLGKMWTGLKLAYGAATSLKMGLEALKAVYIAQTGVQNASTLAVLRHYAATQIAAGGARVMAAAQAALNFVMSMNPVLAVIAGLTALAAVFVLLYTKVKWFHNAVNDVWAWIKDHWQLLGSIILAPFSGPLSVVVGLFNTVKSVAVTAFNGVKDAIGWVIDKLKAAFRWVLNLTEKIENLPGIKQVKGFVHGAGHATAGGRPIRDAMSVGLDTVPGQANGGTTRRPGLSWVGEEGPELLQMPRGAVVTPLPRLAQERKPETPSIAGALADADYRVVQVQVPVHLDGKVIYEAVGTVARDKASRR